MIALSQRGERATSFLFLGGKERRSWHSDLKPRRSSVAEKGVEKGAALPLRERALLLPFVGEGSNRPQDAKCTRRGK